MPLAVGAHPFCFASRASGASGDFRDRQSASCSEKGYIV